jgi:hypothetical protein
MCLSFVSAITKQRLLKALEATVKVLKIQQRIATLNSMNTCWKWLKLIHHLQQKEICEN